MTDLAQMAAVFGIVAQKTDRDTKVPIDGEGFEKAFAALANASSDAQQKPAETVFDMTAPPPLNEVPLSAVAPSMGFPFPMASPSKEQVILGSVPEVNGDFFGEGGLVPPRASESQTSLIQIQNDSKREVFGAIDQTMISAGNLEEKLNLPISLENQKSQTELTREGDPAKLIAALPDSVKARPEATALFAMPNAVDGPDKKVLVQATPQQAVANLPEPKTVLRDDVRGANTANELQGSTIRRPASEILVPPEQSRFEQRVDAKKVLDTRAIVERQPSSSDALEIGRSGENARVDEAPKVLPASKLDIARDPSTLSIEPSEMGDGIKSALKEGFSPEQESKVDAKPLGIDLSANQSRRPLVENGIIARAESVESSAGKAQPTVVDEVQTDALDPRHAAWVPGLTPNVSTLGDDIATVLEPQKTPGKAPENTAQVASNINQSLPALAPQAMTDNTGKQEPKVQIDPSRPSASEPENSIYDIRIAKEDVVSTAAPTARSADAPLNAAFANVDTPLQSRTREHALDAEIASLIQSNSASTSGKAMDAVVKAPAVAVPGDVMKLSEQLRAGARMDRFPVEIALDPPELGQVRMMLQSNESGTTLVILADRPETADLMRKHAAFLHEAFAQEARGELNLQFGSQSGQGDSGEKDSLGGGFGGSRTNDAGSQADTDRMSPEKSITDRHRQIGQMSKTLNLTL